MFGSGVSRPLQPSYEELAALVMVLAAKVEALEAEVASLRRQLGRGSSNSSMPSSKDASGAGPRAPRPVGGRRPGGQKGRRGTGLQRVAVPDRVQVVEPPGCTRLRGGPGRRGR
ncbi:MAG: DUF6444 domain-containing protein [Streptomycetales bacterium]